MITFNYVQELERCPEIREPDAAFNQRVQMLNRNVVDFLRGLARYSILWHQDKVKFILCSGNFDMFTTRNKVIDFFIVKPCWSYMPRRGILSSELS